MSKFIRPLMLLLIGIASIGMSIAHHSSAMFDSSKRVTLQGTVKKFMFTNPHSWIYLTVVDASGNEAVWELEGGSTSHMARSGWTYKTIKAGDKISVIVSPRVDGANGGSFSTVTLSDGTSITSSPAV